MPGWGTGSFENEDAQSFLGRLNSLRLDDLRQMLTLAADQDYPEAPESGALVAAAEVVAAPGAPASDATASPATPARSVVWILKTLAGIPPRFFDHARRAPGEAATPSPR